MPDEQPITRLNKFLAFEMGISRRAADELIQNGSVTINGSRAIVGDRVQPTDSLAVHGKPIVNQTAPQLIMLNKPTNYVCSRKQQGESPTIYALLPKQFHTLKPVGRLDRDSSGLILLTNDGDFAHRMTHPKFYKMKQYSITLDAALEPLHRQMISDFGVMLPDGKSKFELMRLDEADDTRWIVTMHEGRNRQIRRTFNALGYAVVELHRTDFGEYHLDNLRSGSYREIT